MNSFINLINIFIYKMNVFKYEIYLKYNAAYDI